MMMGTVHIVKTSMPMKGETRGCTLPEIGGGRAKRYLTTHAATNVESSSNDIAFTSSPGFYMVTMVSQ